MSKLDILNLEWPQSDRDLNISIPVMVYLKKKYKLKVKTKSIFNGYYYILMMKPKLVIISNTTGAVINYEITKLAYEYGIKVVSFVSEGNTLELGRFFFWGHNKDERFFLNKLLVWSQQYYDFHSKENGIQFEGKVAISGAVGFDRYKILNFQDKNKFLEENKLKYKKIIGIGAWGFDAYFGEYFKQFEKHYMSIKPLEQIEMHRNDLYKLREIYKTMIEANPDILFVLRYHPGTIDFEKNEFYGLDIYDNVFISNKYINNLKIADLINISDLWIGYETTTALEAWLLNKQTFLINPTRSDFKRENIHKGSPIVKTSEEAQKLIDEFYENSTIKSFEFLEEERKKIIKDTIGYDDGKNHQRAAEEIVKVLNEEDREIKFSMKIYIEAAKQILKLILSKTIFKNRWPNLKYKSDFAKKYQDIYSEAIDV